MNICVCYFSVAFSFSTWKQQTVEIISITESFKNAPCKRFASPQTRRWKEKTQVEKACATSQLLFHGCQVPRMLQDYYSVQPCTDCCALCGVFYCFMSIHRWSGEINRRMLIQTEAKLKVPITIRCVYTTLNDFSWRCNTYFCDFQS